MEQNKSNDHKSNVKCRFSSSLSCPDCKTVNHKVGQERQGESPQLYAREVEHYFFYYSVSETDAKHSV
jgi:hypothetical protein